MSIRKTVKGFVLAGAVPLFCLLFVSQSLAAETNTNIDRIRYKSLQGHTRVVLDLSGSAIFEYSRLKDPDRLFIDLNNSSLNREISNSMSVSDGLLKQIRVSQHKGQKVRVVLDLLNVEGYKIFRLSDPSRVVVDIFGSGAVQPVKREEKVVPRISPNGADQLVKSEEKVVPRISPHRVVLDPGHGGRDPGALGPGGIREKDIVLDIVRRVKRILEVDKGYEVHLTRSRDSYLSLEKRTQIANRKKADLFVSVHLNANRRRVAKGLETYLLNWTDNEEAIRVAARENKISFKRMRQSRSELGVILASLQLQNKRDESLKLAHYVQDSMVSSLRHKYSSVEDHGVKQALFYVLLGAEMPSVLVEGSYITNYSEAKRLKSKVYREYLARGIASGIKTYFANTGPVREIAKR
jgi:N-acetylmuramoyl-L-alanine amidase